MQLNHLVRQGCRRGLYAPCRLQLSSSVRNRLRTTGCAAIGPGGDKGPKGALKKFAQEAERHAHQLIDCLTPKQEYDLADVTLIFFSTMVFMWLAAGLYRVYAYTYYFSAHQQTIGAFWGQ